MQEPTWSLIFLLPNVDLTDPDPYYEPALTLHLRDIAIVGTDDDRVAEIRRWSPAADSLVRAFRNEYDELIAPAALIAKRGWLATTGKDPTPIVAFRNAVAMASVLATRARRGGNGRGIYWSDTMDFHPAQLSVDGKRVDIGTPALRHWHVPTEKLHLVRDAGLPRAKLSLFDDYLARELGRAWHARYVRRRGVRRWDVLFRSLEIAYHAAAVRFKNYGSIHEAGLGAALWVSAIEILAAPSAGTKNVN
jgi:hypothetical protein